MLTSDLIEETFISIYSNKVRSTLTILGIVIGIASVVAMISIGQGAQKQIQSNIENIGSNLIMVMPSFQKKSSSGARSSRGAVPTLTIEDSQAIEKQVSSIQAIAPTISKNYQVIAKALNTNTKAIGTTPSYGQIRDIEIDSGSFITDQHIKGFARVVILGPTTRDDLFGENSSPIGQKIKIKNNYFTVVGITKPKGGTGFNNQDDVIFIPITTVQRVLAGKNKNYINDIYIQAPDQESMAGIQEEVTNILLSRHNISDPQLADFSVLNQADIMATASSVTKTFTLFLAAIAGISLIVGGIGIMNMMLTTVTERTREIGLRKAIGAKNKDISLQFLAEATTLTIIGGVVGVVLGWLVSLLITKFGGISTSISIFSILLAFGVSAAIGIGFGYWPAQKAAKLNPIEALRYE